MNVLKSLHKFFNFILKVFYETSFLCRCDINTPAAQLCYFSARRWQAAGFDTGGSWVTFIRTWPWIVSVLGNCLRFEPEVNGVHLMEKNLFLEVMSTVRGAGKASAVLFLLEPAQRSACVSKGFHRRINQWQWTSHWSDSPIVLISLPRSRALGGHLFDVLVPCVSRYTLGCGQRKRQSQFILDFCCRACWDCK